MRLLILFFLASSLFASYDPLGFFPFTKKSELISTPRNPHDAIDSLFEGNLRYVKGHIKKHTHYSVRRMELQKEQRPFAVIVGCSDSRVPPEIIFDQGLGDLFVVRVAGQVVGPIELDSIEYGVKYLGASVIFVLGHENCGAVNAVLSNQTTDIEDVAALIRPAIQTNETLENAVKSNVRYVVEDLKNTRVIRQLKLEGKVDVIGGYYHLPNGRVEPLL